MDENATHHFPLLEPSLTPLRMLKPNARKTSFSKQKVFVLENIIPSFGKYIELPFKANCWVIFPKQSWVSLRDELLDNSPRQFFGKSSLEIPFTTIFPFSFLSCHALTPNFLGCPVHMKCIMSFPNHTCQYINYAYINKIYIPTTCYLFMAITSKLAHMG